MDNVLDSVSVWFAVFAAVGLSAERLVEVIKNRVPWLDAAREDPDEERKRKFWLRVMTMVIATLIVYSAQAQLRDLLPFLRGRSGLELWWSCFLVGLLGSSGADFWNQGLAIVTKVKDLKRLDLDQARKLARQEEG
jgi:hypothetical protein